MDRNTALCVFGTSSKAWLKFCVTNFKGIMKPIELSPEVSRMAALTSAIVDCRCVSELTLDQKLTLAVLSACVDSSSPHFAAVQSCRTDLIRELREFGLLVEEEGQDVVH